MKKQKVQVILVDELGDVLRELLQAQKPLIPYDWTDNSGMMRSALFAKDRAIDRAVNFLYNKGVRAKV